MVQAAGVAETSGIPDANKTISADTITIDGNEDYGMVAYWKPSDPNDKLSNYKVIINNSKLAYTNGIFVIKGDATNNHVVISNGSEINYVSGARSVDAGNVISNSVEINNSKVTNSVYGGYAEGSGDANDNSVTITNGAKVEKTVYGGYAAGTGDANGNSVTITNATVYNIKCGISYKGNANGNIVKIIDSKTDDSVFGGYSKETDKTANNNIVIVSNSKIGYNLVGGYSENGAATGNKIAIANGSIIKNHVYGCDDLYIANFNNQARDIEAEKSLNFVITNPFTDGDSMLKISDDNTTSISEKIPNKFDITLAGTSGNAANKTIALIAKENLEDVLDNDEYTDGVFDGFDSVENKTRTLNQGATISYEAELTLSEDKKSINLEIHEGTVNDNGKSVVETRAVAGYVVNNMTDFMLSSGMMQAKAAAGEDKDAAFAPFVAVGGSNSRYETGSHVDVDGWNAAVGFAKTAGNATYGVAVEHGRGDYDSYVGAVHGEGDIKSTGGVLFGQIKNANGVHYDASLRAGRVKSDYKSAATSYDDSATYYGLTLGAGKEISYTEKASLDLYGRYYFTHIADSDATLATGEAVDFDSLNSHRIRLGGRYTSDINEKSAAYAGLAWQYEFGGDAEAAINGIESPTPSLQGHSAIIEAGYKLQSGKNMSLDFNVTGWLGKQRGIGGAIDAQWAF
ncbi:MAG: autotransporter outer membrane beta-barrel domain-containing protein [Phascolarctobacterium sp.]|nr:autotransporter outer membrane beta-barrel domain-containing protein [Phascolarctobacterium sp.]